MYGITWNCLSSEVGCVGRVQVCLAVQRRRLQRKRCWKCSRRVDSGEAAASVRAAAGRRLSSPLCRAGTDQVRRSHDARHLRLLSRPAGVVVVDRWNSPPSSSSSADHAPCDVTAGARCGCSSWSAGTAVVAAERRAATTAVVSVQSARTQPTTLLSRSHTRAERRDIGWPIIPMFWLTNLTVGL